MATTLSEESAQQMRIAAQRELYRDLAKRLLERGLRIEEEPLRLDALSTFMAKLVADNRVSMAELEEAMITYRVQRLKQELHERSNGKR